MKINPNQTKYDYMLENKKESKNKQGFWAKATQYNE